MLFYLAHCIERALQEWSATTKSRNWENTCAFLSHITTHDRRVIIVQIIWLHIKRKTQGEKDHTVF